MTYKDAIRTSMEILAEDPKTLFIGYNVKYGSKANGTLVNIPDNQLIETPVAENLIVSMAIGLSLEGFKPVVYIERFDFVIHAADAIVNHLDKIKQMSHGEFDPRVIIRTVVGNKANPLFTGATHTQNFSKAFREMCDMPVIELPLRADDIITIYNADESCLIVEDKDLYTEQC